MFFVPAGATLVMGPTAIIPGSHLMSVDHADWSQLRDETDLTALFPEAVEHKLTAPAHTGVAVLLHHSLFHRGTARLSEISDDNPWRPMVGFLPPQSAVSFLFVPFGVPPPPAPDACPVLT